MFDMYTPYNALRSTVNKNYFGLMALASVELECDPTTFEEDIFGLNGSELHAAILDFVG